MSLLQRVGDDLWIAEGPPVFFLSFRFPTRMAIARLPDGGLWLWSPVALDDRLRDEINRSANRVSRWSPTHSITSRSPIG